MVFRVEIFYREWCIEKDCSMHHFILEHFSNTRISDKLEII